MCEAYGQRPFAVWFGEEDCRDVGAFAFDLAVLAIGRMEQQKQLREQMKKKG